MQSAGAYGYYRGEVEVMLGHGCALNTIEGVVDRLPLDADGRSALWLLAWSGAGGRSGEPLVDVVPLRR